MRISDWSSDVCSSDLVALFHASPMIAAAPWAPESLVVDAVRCWREAIDRQRPVLPTRSEEHTSELQSLMRISYAVFCLKKKKSKTSIYTPHESTNNTNMLTSYYNV